MNKNHKLSLSLKETSNFKTNKKTKERLEKEKLNIVIEQLKNKFLKKMEKASKKKRVK